MAFRPRDYVSETLVAQASDLPSLFLLTQSYSLWTALTPTGALNVSFGYPANEIIRWDFNRGWEEGAE